MKSRFILEIDHLASIEANLQFLEKCERSVLDKKRDLKRKQKEVKQPKQLDLIEESEK